MELLSPGASIPADVQRKQLEQGAHMLLMLLEKEYASESPVTKALKDHPDNLILREWSDHEAYNDFMGSPDGKSYEYTGRQAGGTVTDLKDSINLNVHQGIAACGEAVGP